MIRDILIMLAAVAAVVAFAPQVSHEHAREGSG